MRDNVSLWVELNQFGWEKGAKGCAAHFGESHGEVGHGAADDGHDEPISPISLKFALLTSELLHRAVLGSVGRVDWSGGGGEGLFYFLLGEAF